MVFQILTSFSLFPFPVRLPPGSSLFDTVPSHQSTMSSHKFCNCEAEPHSASPRARPQPISSSDSTCSHHGNVRLSSIIPTLDVTAEYMGSVELLRQPLLPRHSTGRYIQDGGSDPQPHKRSFPTGDGAGALDHQQGHRGRRQTHHYNSRHQSLSQSDLEGFTYYFPEDHEAAVPADVSLTWPTPSGMTEQQARARCQQAVANSSLALGCRRLLEESIISQAVSMCVTDLQLKDETSWVNATLPLLENECERRLIEKRRREQEHQDVVALLKCPNLCNWNGQCSEWGCVCFPGFGSYDCSSLSGKKSVRERRIFFCLWHHFVY